VQRERVRVCGDSFNRFRASYILSSFSRAGVPAATRAFMEEFISRTWKGWFLCFSRDGEGVLGVVVEVDFAGLRGCADPVFASDLCLGRRVAEVNDTVSWRGLVGGGVSGSMRTSMTLTYWFFRTT